MSRDREIRKFILQTRGGQLDVLGRCMEPILQGDWRVRVDSVDKDKIKIGDIAVFNRTTFICHRIIGRLNLFTKTFFVHKGDNSSIGGIFLEKDLIGKVIEVFDDKGQRIPKEKWEGLLVNDSNRLLWCIYLFLYLTKKVIFGNKPSRTTGFINRIFWRIAAV